MVDRPPVRFAHPLVGTITLTRDNLDKLAQLREKAAAPGALRTP